MGRDAAGLAGTELAGAVRRAGGDEQLASNAAVLTPKLLRNQRRRAPRQGDVFMAIAASDWPVLPLT